MAICRARRSKPPQRQPFSSTMATASKFQSYIDIPSSIWQCLWDGQGPGARVDGRLPCVCVCALLPCRRGRVDTSTQRCSQQERLCRMPAVPALLRWLNQCAGGPTSHINPGARALLFASATTRWSPLVGLTWTHMHTVCCLARTHTQRTVVADLRAPLFHLLAATGLTLQEAAEVSSLFTSAVPDDAALAALMDGAYRDLANATSITDLLNVQPLLAMLLAPNTASSPPSSTDSPVTRDGVSSSDVRFMDSDKGRQWLLSDSQVTQVSMNLHTYLDTLMDASSCITACLM